VRNRTDLGVKSVKSRRALRRR
jgi:hypothetical protein